jgi:hypothetical protein
MNLKTLKGETYKHRLLLDYLRDLSSIRSSCSTVFTFAQQDQLQYFAYHPEELDAVADYVITVMLRQYPHLDIPIHSRLRHLEVAGVDRLKLLNTKVSSENYVKSVVELIIVSILLDAGAGPNWRYMDHLSSTTLQRSEGLAAASFNLFMQGLFSSDPANSCQVDSLGLQKMHADIFAAGLQISSQNNLVGFESRIALLQQLGICIEQHPEYFGNDLHPRLGNIVDYWQSHVVNDSLSMQVIFNSLLDAFSDIWPGRYEIDDVNLGDVWPYQLNETELNPRGFIPFHKLTQWLCYSLIEPLQFMNIDVVDTDLLTALPEYRNGGLLVDLKLLTPRNKDMFRQEHNVGSEFIVEWRAMTVAIIDHLAEIIRIKLNLTTAELSLGQILQGGTWLAGRLSAQHTRNDFTPPFKIISDGTVF